MFDKFKGGYGNVKSTPTPPINEALIPKLIVFTLTYSIL